MFETDRQADPGDIDTLSIGYVTGPLSSTSSQECLTKVVITYTNRIFLETARGLQQTLERSGYRGVEVWGDVYFAMDSKYSPGGCPLPLHIAIAPHEETMLLPRYVVYHMEQSWSIFNADQRYGVVLRQAQAVWIFSEQHRALMLRLGVQPHLVRLVAMPIDKSYAKSSWALLAETTSQQQEQQHYAVDIAMFGSSSERRMSFANDLMRNASLPPYAAMKLKLSGGVGGAENAYFGRRRDWLVRTSKVCP